MGKNKLATLLQNLATLMTKCSSKCNKILSLIPKMILGLKISVEIMFIMLTTQAVMNKPLGWQPCC